MNLCAPCSSRPNLIFIKPGPPIFKTLSLLRGLHSPRLRFVSRFFTKNIFSFCGCKVKSFFFNLQILFQKFFNFFFPLNPLLNAASNPPGIAAVVLKSGCKYRHAFLFYNTFPKKDFAFLYNIYADHLYINYLSVNKIFMERVLNKQKTVFPLSKFSFWIAEWVISTNNGKPTSTKQNTLRSEKVIDITAPFN